MPIYVLSQGDGSSIPSESVNLIRSSFLYHLDFSSSIRRATGTTIDIITNTETNINNDIVSGTYSLGVLSEPVIDSHNIQRYVFWVNTQDY